MAWRAVAVAVLIGTAVGGGVPVAVGGDAACRVTNVRTGEVGAGLAAALERAAPGDTLTVAGTCPAGVSLAREVTLAADAADPAAPATLVPERRGATLVVGAQATVTVSGLTIVGGAGETCFRVLRCGGAIHVSGTLSLMDTVVDGGRGKLGGALYLRRGTTTLSGSTTVAGGRALVGGGAYVEDRATLVLADAAAIAGNSASDSGGGVQLFGELYLSGTAAIRDNSTRAVGGGGVYLERGRLGLVGSSTIAANRARRGGGIYALSGIVQVGEAASLAGNTADAQGGGAFLDTVLELRGTARIDGNVAGSAGGGVFGGPNLILSLFEDASIVGNRAATGGGVYDRGVIGMEGSATITGNTADAGAGVWFDLGILTGPYCGRAIRENVTQDCNLDEG
ncbi:MAG: hypothetical protein ACKOTZ_06605 [Chloroflexota bacterium]